ncbi:hypothetical protein HZA99_00515 [Candidatus Woesearchaeota archaeon]|nr:hypothetical protein [Candidatus Woesearchaeota archaeon]
MTDSAEPIIPEIVTSGKLVDRLRRNRVFSEEEFERQVKREEMFFALQRELFISCLGRDMGVLTDYDDAGGPSGFEAVLSGKDYFEGQWVLENIIGKEKAERHIIDRETEEGKAVVRENLLLYQKDILFAQYSAFVSKKEGINFYIVRKSNCSRRERGKIIAKADDILDILAYGNEYYMRQLKYNPWEEITKTIRGIVARAEPMMQRPYIRTGIVSQWCERDTEFGYSPGGMAVEEGRESVILDNWNKEDAEKHIGQQVRFLYQGPYLGMGWAVGKLVAPQLYIPIPLQEQLSIK